MRNSQPPKAALERNPVSIAEASGLSPDESAGRLEQMDCGSIYGGARMAQPDEVWNFGRGDGLEKAVCLLNILKSREEGAEARLDGEGGTVRVSLNGKEYLFRTRKGLTPPTEDDCAFRA